MPAPTDLMERLAAAVERGEDVLPEAAEEPHEVPEPVPPGLFVAQPVPLGHGSLAAGGGDWFTHSVTGAPLLVVRGYDGALRGFLNVCRHQGGRVVAGEHGTGASGFRCTNHDWSYDTTGRLVGAPEPDDVDPTEGVGLYPVPVTERHGLVFALPSTAKVSLDAWLGSLDADLAALDLGACRVERLRERTRSVSWIDLASLLVDVPRLLGGQAPGPMVHEVVGPHQRFAVAPAGTAPEEVAARAVRGLFLFPSTLVLARAGQASLVGAFRQQGGLVGWRHEILVRPGAPADLAAGVTLEQRLFAVESERPSRTRSPGVRALRGQVARAVVALG